MSGDLLIRAVRGDAEFADFLNVSEQTFGDTTTDEAIERLRPVLRPERCHGAFDNGMLVATAAAYDFTLTVPGAEIAAAGITMVGVLPTHRRRGILRELMRVQLDDVHRRGEPVAILHASEPAIYGRFGYGLAVRGLWMDAERDAIGFRTPPADGSRVRLVPPEDAYDVVAPVYERIRRATPGMFRRTEEWWRSFRLSDPPEWREGAGPLFVAVLELDGDVCGFARYRLKDSWEQGVPRGRVVVSDAVADSPRATIELWRYLFGIDLVATVWFGPLSLDHALLMSVVDVRRLHARLGDSVWLRIVDVETALAARGYATDARVVVELEDAFCPWNAGRWELGPEGASRTRARAELRLGAEELGAVYLGGCTVSELAAAARVEELRPGAVARADALLRTDRAPWCPDGF